MNDLVAPATPNDGRAFAWLCDSLSNGAAVSARMLTVVREASRGSAILVPSRELALGGRLSEGGGTAVSAADEALAELLEVYAERGAHCLLVEDDLRRRGDPALRVEGRRSAYLDDRVIHWVDIAKGAGASAVDAVRSGASGYPTNAFVSVATADELDLVSGGTFGSGSLELLERSLIAVIVAAFDAEAYVLWERDGSRSA